MRSGVVPERHTRHLHDDGRAGTPANPRRMSRVRATSTAICRARCSAFGMKAHVGVDSKTKLIHSAAATPANVHDSVMLPSLLHGRETRVYGDAAYCGKTETIRSI